MTIKTQNTSPSPKSPSLLFYWSLFKFFKLGFLFFNHKIIASNPITSWLIDEEKLETVKDFIFLGSQITAHGDWRHEIKRHLLLGRKDMTNLDSVLKSRDVTLLTKVHMVEAMVFPVVMYTCELNHKEVWEPKNWCFWNVVLEKTLESPLDSKEIKPINPKWNQLWIFIGRTNTKAEAPRVWSFDVKSWLIGKDPDAWKDRRQEEKRMRWLDGIIDSMDMSLSKLQEMVSNSQLPGVASPA